MIANVLENALKRGVSMTTPLSLDEKELFVSEIQSEIAFVNTVYSSCFNKILKAKTYEQVLNAQKELHKHHVYASKHIWRGR
jgi:hypothetical protein